MSKLCLHIHHLFQTCLKMRHHLKRFKKINTVILKKLKKSDYLQLKIYRLIILLNILNKTFETIVIKCLNDYAEKHNLLSKK